MLTNKDNIAFFIFFGYIGNTAYLLTGKNHYFTYSASADFVISATTHMNGIAYNDNAQTLASIDVSPDETGLSILCTVPNLKYVAVNGLAVLNYK